MTVGVPLPDAPASVADRRAFTAQGVTFTAAEIARRANATSHAPQLIANSPHEAEEAFRRSRGLLTGDQLEAWLGSWEIAAADFRAWTEDVAAGTSNATSWCALHCSGAYEAVAAELLAAVAAACELGDAPVAPSQFDPAGWTDRLVDATVTPDILSTAISSHRLDWTQVQVISAVAQSRAIAEELRHQVLSDGADLAVAATDAECATQHLDGPLSGFPAASVRSALAGAHPGEVLGPIRLDSGWALFHVLTRIDPSLDDARTRALAETTLRHQVIARAVARHVVA